MPQHAPYHAPAVEFGAWIVWTLARFVCALGGRLIRLAVPIAVFAVCFTLAALAARP